MRRNHRAGRSKRERKAIPLLFSIIYPAGDHWISSSIQESHLESIHHYFHKKIYFPICIKRVNRKTILKQPSINMKCLYRYECIKNVVQVISPLFYAPGMGNVWPTRCWNTAPFMPDHWLCWQWLMGFVVLQNQEGGRFPTTPYTLFKNVCLSIC